MTSIPKKIEEPVYKLHKLESFDFSDDPLTCLSVNRNTPYLAIGSKSGKIIIYDLKDKLPRLYSQFVSHAPEFDYLKSTEILEKINCIEWLPQVGMSMNILTANERTIKYWRLTERNIEIYNPSDTEFPCIPKYRKSEDSTLRVKIRKNYNNAHTYFINSLVVNNDQETFYSSDDLQINLWNLEYNSSAYVIVDMKPDNLEDLSEIITCLRVAPESSSLFAYSLSTGRIRICDTRIKSNCDSPVNEFFSVPIDNFKFFQDLICNISDIRYSQDGNKIIARDYFTQTEWDTRFAKDSLRRFDVQIQLKDQLNSIYEKSRLFDRFHCTYSSNDRFIITGSYGNTIRIFDLEHPDKPGSLYCLNDSLILDDDFNILKYSYPQLKRPCTIASPEDAIGKYLNLKSLSLLSIDEYHKQIDKLALSMGNNEAKEFSPSSTHGSEVRGSKKRKQSIKLELNSIFNVDLASLYLTCPVLHLDHDARQDRVYMISDNRHFMVCSLDLKDNYSPKKVDEEDSKSNGQSNENVTNDNDNGVSSSIFQESTTRKRKVSQ